MARPSNKQRSFVKLYVSGPDGVRGDWLACAKACELDPPPSQDDVMIARLIEAEVPAPKVRSPLSDLEKLFKEGERGIPWRDLRAKLVQTIESVADGTVQARAAQVSMLRLIIEKAEQQGKQEDSVHSIVVLPHQGEKAEMGIDAEWLAKLKSLETMSANDDETPDRDSLDPEQGTADSIPE